MRRKLLVNAGVIIGITVLSVVSLAKPVNEKQPVVTVVCADPVVSGSSWISTFPVIAQETDRVAPIPVIPLTGKEKELMVRLAQAEAEIEGVKGKALVMNVVWNRVKDERFPDTVKGVVYQERQFSVIANGRFDSVTPDKECYKALEMFMNGWDQSQGALYFEEPSDSTWHQDNLDFLFRYNRHYFYTERGEGR